MSPEKAKHNISQIPTGDDHLEYLKEFNMVTYLVALIFTYPYDPQLHRHPMFP